MCITTTRSRGVVSGERSGERSASPTRTRRDRSRSLPSRLCTKSLEHGNRKAKKLERTVVGYDTSLQRSASSLARLQGLESVRMHGKGKKTPAGHGPTSACSREERRGLLTKFAGHHGVPVEAGVSEGTPGPLRALRCRVDEHAARPERAPGPLDATLPHLQSARRTTGRLASLM